MAAYETLLTLNLFHTYYKSGKSQDLQYKPVSETLRLLKQQRMLYKELGGGFGIIYEKTGTGTPTLSIDNDLDFVFGIGLVNPAHFLGITALDEKAPSTVQFANSCRMYFYTDGAASELKYKVLHNIYPEQFGFSFSAPAVTDIKVTISNEAGSAVVAEYDTSGNPVAGPYTINSGTTPGQFRKFFDLGKAGPGFYNINVKKSSDNSNLADLQVYVHDELSRSEVSGVIKIKHLKPTLPLSATSLRISLERATTKWKYYIVNKSGLDLNDIDLVLFDNSGDAGPIYSVYTFNGNPNLGGGGQPAPNAANSIGGLDTLVFESTAAIPFYEEPKKGLRLKTIDDGHPTTEQKKVVYENLPNPAPTMRGGQTSKVIVYV